MLKGVNLLHTKDSIVKTLDVLYHYLQVDNYYAYLVRGRE